MIDPWEDILANISETVDVGRDGDPELIRSGKRWVRRAKSTKRIIHRPKGSN